MSDLVLASKGYVDSKIDSGKEYVDISNGPGKGLQTLYGQNINFYMLAGEKKVVITHILLPAVSMIEGAGYIAPAQISTTTITGPYFINEEPLAAGTNTNVWVKCSGKIWEFENPTGYTGWIGNISFFPRSTYLFYFKKNEDGSYTKVTTSTGGQFASSVWTAGGSPETPMYFTSTHPRSNEWSGGPRLRLLDNYSINYYPVYGIRYKVYTEDNTSNNSPDSLATKEYVDSLS